MKSHPHPGGRSKAFCRVLDEIGCGNRSPIMSKATRDAMLAKGLIHQLSDRKVPDSTTGWAIVIQQFEMPLHIHLQWCCSE